LYFRAVAELSQLENSLKRGYSGSGVNRLQSQTCTSNLHVYRATNVYIHS